jgi:hypothetical protein
MKNVFKDNKLVSIIPVQKKVLREGAMLVEVELPTAKDEVVVEGNIAIDDFDKATLVKGKIVVKK